MKKEKKKTKLQSKREERKSKHNERKIRREKDPRCFEKCSSKCVSHYGMGVSLDHDGWGWMGGWVASKRGEGSDSIYAPTMRLCLAKLSYMNLHA